MPLPLLLLLTLAGWTSGVSEEAPPGDDLVVTIHWDETHQTLRGFGASDAWSTQFVGKHWPAARR